MERQQGERRTGRHSEHVTVELGFAGLRQFEAGFAPNLAEDGLFVPCDAPLPPSTVVRLRIVLAGEVVLLEATGVVFWSRTASDRSGPSGMAVRFVTMAPEFEQTIQELLEARRRRGAEVPRLDRVAVRAEWPEAEGTAGHPWEAPEIGYQLVVRPAGPVRDEETVSQLRFFADEAGDEDPGVEAPRGAAGGKAAPAPTPPPPPRPDPAPPAAPLASSGVADEPPDADAPAGDAPAEPGPREPAAGVAFEVSFFEDDGSPDETPRLAESQGPDVMMHLEDDLDDEDETEGGVTGRLRRLLARLPSPLLLLEIAAILLLLWGTKWVVLKVASIGWGGGSAAVADATPTPSPPPPTPEGGGGPPPPTEVAEEDAGTAAAGQTTQPATATPRPTATPSPPPTARPRPTATATSRPSAGGIAVRDVSWTRRDGRTTVTIQADRTFADDAVTVAALTGPPRVLVVIRGVSRPFGRSVIQVGSNELETLRIGYHAEHDPPSLHVVLDLPEEAVRLVEQRVLDDRIELTVAR